MNSLERASALPRIFSIRPKAHEFTVIIACVCFCAMPVDPASGDFLVVSMEDKKKFYALSLKLNEWRQLPDAPISEGVAASIDSYGVTMYFANRPAKVYLYKHAQR